MTGKRPDEYGHYPVNYAGEPQYTVIENRLAVDLYYPALLPSAHWPPGDGDGEPQVPFGLIHIIRVDGGEVGVELL